MDDTYNNDQTALYREVKNLYEQGYNSPLMYMELCEVLNNNPLLLKHITDLEVTTIRWGLRHQYLSDEVIEAFIQLAASFRQFDAKMALEGKLQQAKDRQHEAFTHKYHLIDLLRMSKFTFAQNQAQKRENRKYTFNRKQFLLSNGLYIVIICLFVFLCIITPIL